MASFAQTQQTQFTPYIPQFNTELYAQIGVSKQQQYSENVQKVLGYRDSIAGLKVARDVDSQYLSQKVNELNTNLQQLAGSDFSKSQVLSTAGGYAAQIYSDKTIQNAVMSAQNYADASAQIQEAHKTGKAAASNDNAVLRNIQAWQQGDLNASLGKQQYTNYYNYSKSWQDFMSGKHGNKVYIESDNSGRSSLGVAYTINQGKREYLDSAAVQRDFQTFLQMDAQAQQQVQLDALYYADKTPDPVALQGLRSHLEQTISSYDNSIEILERQKAANTSTADVNRYNAQIRDIQEQKNKLSLQIRSGELDRRFAEDPHTAKMSFFTNNLIVGAGNRYAYEDIENKTVKNPAFDTALDEARLGISYQELQLRYRSEARADSKEAREAAKDARESGSIATLIPTGTDINKPITPEVVISKNQEEGKAVVQQQMEALYNTGNMDSLITIGTDSQGNPTYNLKPGKTNQDFADAWAQVQDQYHKNPNGAKPSIKDYFEAEDDDTYGVGLLRKYTATKNAIVNKEKQLEEQMGNNPRYRDYLNKITQIGNPEENLGTFGGISITRGDLIKYAQASQNNKSLDKIAQEAGFTKEKAKIISEQAAQQYNVTASGVIGDFFGEMIRPITDAFKQDEIAAQSKLQQEYDKIGLIVRDTYKSEFRALRDKAFQTLVPENMPTVAIAESADGSNKKQVYDQIAFLQSAVGDPQRAVEAEQLNKVVNAKNKGEASGLISVGAEKNPITGEVTAIVRNTASDEVARIPLMPEQARIAYPALTTANRNAVIEAELNANRKQRGAGSITSTYYTPQKNNIEGYNFRYKIAQGRGNTFTPVIEFYQQGTDDWQELAPDRYYPSIDQARARMEQIASQNTRQTFENTYLK